LINGQPETSQTWHSHQEGHELGNTVRQEIHDIAYLLPLFPRTAIHMQQSKREVLTCSIEVGELLDSSQGS
jgi:hypothetical protein